MGWHADQRVKAVEIFALWHGRLTGRDLIEAFGVSRNQASKDINEYMRRFPGNIEYSLKERAFLRKPAFQVQLTAGDFNEYLDLIGRMSSPTERIEIERMTPHYKRLNADVVAPVLHAIRKAKGVVIQYASMTRPEGVQRVIFPHSIVDTGFRWHVRAYCADRKGFRDFNLGRMTILSERSGARPSQASPDNDRLWNERVEISLMPNPNLTKDQRKVIENEFAMRDGRLVELARACLVPYLLQRYQIDTTRLENPPSTQLLAVEAPDHLEQFLFPI